MLLSRAVQLFLISRQARCTPGAIKNYASQLYLLRDWLAARAKNDLATITPQDLEAYVYELQTRSQLRRAGKLSPITIHKRIRGLKTFFAWASEQGFSENPSTQLRTNGARRLPKLIARESLKKLLDAPANDRDRAILFLFLDSGLRLGELSALLVQDIDLAAGTVHVRHGKGDKERYAVFSEKTGQALTSYLGLRSSGALFLDLKGQKQLTAKGIYKVVKRLAQSVGIYSEVSPHRLRHTFATLFLNRGGKIHVAQKLLGHESITTTMIYVGVTMEEMKQEHSRFSPLGSED